MEKTAYILNDQEKQWLKIGEKVAEFMNRKKTQLTLTTFEDKEKDFWVEINFGDQINITRVNLELGSIEDAILTAFKNFEERC